MKNSFKKVITFLTSCFVAFTISCAFNAYAAAPRPLTRLKANVKTRFNTVGKKFKSAGSTIKKGFSTAGTGIKRAAGTVKTTATGGFNALKTKAKVAGAGIKTVAGKAKTSITSAVGTVKAKAQTTFGKKPTPVTPATATTTSRAKTAPHELQEGDLAMFNESPTTSTATTTASRAKIKKAKTATTAAAEPAAQPAESATERMLRQQMRGQQIADIVGAVGSTATGITSSVLAGIGQERAAVAAQQAGIGLTRAGQLGTQMYYQGVPITPEQAAQMGVSLTTAGTHIATAATGDQRYQIVGQQVASTIPTAVDLASRAPELVEQIPVLATKLQNMTETMARSLRNGFSSPVFDCTLASDGSSWNQDGDAPGVIRVGVVFNIGNPGFGPFGTPFMNVKGMPFVPEELERIKEVASKIPGLEGYSREIITGIEKFTKDINLPAIVVGGVRVVQLLANSVGSSATMVPSAAAAHALIGMYNVGKTLEIKMPVLEAGKRLSALELPSQRINRTIEELPLWLKLVVKEMVMLTELTITGTGPLPEYIEYSLLDKHTATTHVLGKVGDFIDAAYLTLAMMLSGPLPGDINFTKPTTPITAVQAQKYLLGIVFQSLEHPEEGGFDTVAHLRSLNELVNLQETIGDVATFLAPFGDEVVAAMTVARAESAKAPEAPAPAEATPTPVAEAATTFELEEGDLDLLFKAAQTDPVVAEAIDNAQTPQDLAPILQNIKENQQEQALESPTSDQKKYDALNMTSDQTPVAVPAN